MESLPLELLNMIMSYAHPIHPCKNEIELIKVRFHLRARSPPWDSMSPQTKFYLYQEGGVYDLSY